MQLSRSVGFKLKPNLYLRFRIFNRKQKLDLSPNQIKMATTNIIKKIFGEVCFLLPRDLHYHNVLNLNNQLV